MSNDNDKNISSSEIIEDKASLENLLDDSEETLEIKINKVTNEAILRNVKNNKTIKLKVGSEDETEREEVDEEDDDISPLTPEEFEDGVKRIDRLGLTFSVDLFPSIISKNESSSDLIDAEEFEGIQKDYPGLPREVGLVAHNTLTGAKRGIDSIGGNESFEKKSKIVKELVLTKEYEEDFFFKHALKFPFFESIDWEVVLKTHENGLKTQLVFLTHY